MGEYAINYFKKNYRRGLNKRKIVGDFIDNYFKKHYRRELSKRKIVVEEFND